RPRGGRAMRAEFFRACGENHHHHGRSGLHDQHAAPAAPQARPAHARAIHRPRLSAILSGCARRDTHPIARPQPGFADGFHPPAIRPGDPAQRRLRLDHGQHHGGEGQGRAVGQGRRAGGDGAIALAQGGHRDGKEHHDSRDPRRRAVRSPDAQWDDRKGASDLTNNRGMSSHDLACPRVGVERQGKCRDNRERPAARRSSRLRWVLCVAASAIVAAPLSVNAQSYPSRPITVVVPFPAGGPSDVVARIVTEQMGKILGQSMIIENVGGAGGTIGSARVAAAAADGYTLLAGSMGSHVAAPVLTPNLKYDSERDFIPIGFTAHAPAVIVARKDFPGKDLPEFVAYLKNHGDGVKQAHGGIGSSSHMACLLFTSTAAVQPSLVAYRGTSPALNDLIGGHVDFFCEQAVSVAPQIAAGTIKAYGVSSSERLAVLPNVPTAKEAGVDYRMSIWAGIFAPKGTPREVIDKLAGALD